MKKQLYIQCILSKRNMIRTSFIPEKYAQIGKILKLRNDDVWNDGWRVDSTGASELIDELNINKSIKEHRKRTGDSLTKEQ